MQKKRIQLILLKRTKNFVWACIKSVYLFVNDTEIHKFKAKDSGIVLCLGNISKDYLVDNIKKIGLNRYDFSVDYDVVVVADKLDIHNYLTNKNEIA